MAALEAFEADEDVDGLPFVCAEDAPPPVLGPRQLLLESAPCSACDGTIAREAASLVCDRCNSAFHLRCTKLRAIPATYWYCRRCMSHIHSRGIRCPTEDLALQDFLRTGAAPAH